MLLARLNRNRTGLRVIHAVSSVNINAAHGVHEGLHAIKADLGIVGNLDIAQLINSIDHTLGAIVGMRRVDLHGRAFVLNLCIARNGDERYLLGLRVYARKDN